MANEGNLRINATFTKDSTSLSRSLTDTFDVSGTPAIINIQSIGTSDETLTVGDVSSLGYIVCKNRDATNYLELGYTSGTYFAKLKAGEICAFRAGSGLTTIHAKANTAACDLEYFLISD